VPAVAGIMPTMDAVFIPAGYISQDAVVGRAGNICGTAGALAPVAVGMVACCVTSGDKCSKRFSFTFHCFAPLAAVGALGVWQ